MSARAEFIIKWNLRTIYHASLAYRNPIWTQWRIRASFNKFANHIAISSPIRPMCTTLTINFSISNLLLTLIMAILLIFVLEHCVLVSKGCLLQLEVVVKWWVWLVVFLTSPEKPLVISSKWRRLCWKILFVNHSSPRCRLYLAITARN